MFIKLVRCTKDAETFTTPSGKSGLRINFAFDAGYGDNKTTTWCKGTFWGDRAVNLQQYLSKGKQFVVKGDDLKCSSYDGKNGLSLSLDMTVLGVELVAGGQAAPVQVNTQARPQTQAAQKADEFEDDLPF